MKEIPIESEPVVAQALLNLIESGCRIISPDGQDATEYVRRRSATLLSSEENE